MIPLTLACIIGGCLDIPIDNRPIHRQVIGEFQRQNPGKKKASSCYINGTFHKQCPEEGSSDEEYNPPRIRDPRLGN